jgi:RNA polymerase sigma-70 factor (ECF subfamily)
VTNHLAADAALIQRIAAGDRAALRELRLRYRATAYATAYSVVADPEDAETAVAQAFERAFLDASRLSGLGASAVQWLSDLTRSAAYGLRRSA